MNTLILFLAGVSLGLAADKMYHLAVANKKCTEKDGKEEGGVETIEEQVDENEKAEIKKQEPARTEALPGEAEERHDDLSQLKGVGPKLAAALDEISIYNYEQLSSSSIDMLVDQLRETGGKFSRSAISSIVERAQLAVNEK